MDGLYYHLRLEREALRLTHDENVRKRIYRNMCMYVTEFKDKIQKDRLS